MNAAARTARARVAAHSRWAKCNDRKAATSKARQTFLARFESHVDPHGVLPPEERERRARNALKAHMAGLALKRHT